MHRPRLTLAALLACAIPLAAAAPGILIAQDGAMLSTTARKLLDSYGQSLVLVRTFGKMSAKTNKGDLPPTATQVRQSMGVTIAKNGLVAVSNTAIDGSVELVGIKAQNGQDVSTINEAKTDFEKIELTYLIFKGATRKFSTVSIAGKVVFQDVASDLALILPDRAGAATVLKSKFTPIDTAPASETVKEGEKVISLTMASEIYDNMPMVSVHYVSGSYNSGKDNIAIADLIEKKSVPSQPYLLTGTPLGVPVFNARGEFIGITLNTMSGGKPTGMIATLPAEVIRQKADKL